jgi:hypothetical protein
MNPYRKGIKEKQKFYVSIEDRVRAAIGNPECRNIDFKLDCYKQSKKDKRLEFLKDVAAFANADGGLIIMGVEDPDRSGTVIGLSKKDIEYGRTQLRDWAVNGLLPNSDPISFHEIDYINKKLLVVKIEKGLLAPYHYHKADGHEIPVRKGDRNRAARVEEIASMLKCRPHSIAQKQALQLAKELRDLTDTARTVRGVLYSETAAKQKNKVFHPDILGLSEMRMLTVYMKSMEVIDFSTSYSDNCTWSVGSRILLGGSDLAPQKIVLPPVLGWFSILSDQNNGEYLDDVFRLLDLAGIMLSNYSQELFGSHHLWSAFDQTVLSKDSSAWLAALVYWQLEQRDSRFILDDRHPADLFENNDPKEVPFAVLIDDDLCKASARLLEWLGSN